MCLYVLLLVRDIVLLVQKLYDASLYDALKHVLDNPEVISTWKKSLETTKLKFGAAARGERASSIFRDNK